MGTDERLDAAISSWLVHTAPGRLPDRTLEATFERTRRTRQQASWRGLLGRSRITVFAPVLGGAAVAVVAATLAFGSLFGRPGVGGPVATPDPRSAFLGTWISTSDADGGTQTMTVRATPNGAVEIMVTDDIASVCGGTPSTMAGTGRVEDETKLVIPAPVYTCDDGREPRALSGPPLAEQLRDLTYVLDAQADLLTVAATSVWRRQVAPTPSPAGQASDPIWPQSSLEEVGQAQRLADAGDPRYTWQVSPDRWYQPGQHHPIDTEFFARFFREKLGWDGFRWEEKFAHPDGLEDGDVVFIRCGPGEANPLYPNDPEAGCAPTIDELQYQTVKVNIAQPAREGGSGIWVVTGWETIEPARQVAPPTDAEISALLDAFAQQRIDGGDAGAFVDVAANDPLAAERVDRAVPLLYATSNGAAYERSEFEIADGPMWPDGRVQLRVRLFARNDDTVVEQRFALERDEAGRLRLVYDFSSDSPATTENGEPVPVEYGFLDGVVTYRAAAPLGPSQDGYRDRDRLAITGLLPDDDAPRRVLLMLADPRPIGPGCVEAPAPADAEALARSIGSDPDFVTTAPVAVTIAGLPALQLDVALAPGARPCPWSEPEVSGTNPLLLAHAPFMGVNRARLYLLDLPGGSGASVLALVTISDDDSLETVLEWAAPVVGSIEIHQS